MDVNDDPLIEDLREVRSFFYMSQGSRSSNSFVSGLNDHGQLAVNIEFTDLTSGVFVLTVPSTGGASLFLMGTGLLAHRRRRY